MCLVSKLKCFLKSPKSLICALSRDAGHCNTRIQCRNWGSKTFHPFPHLPCTPPWSHFSPSLSVLHGCYNEDQHEKAEVHYNQISHPILRRQTVTVFFSAATRTQAALPPVACRCRCWSTLIRIWIKDTFMQIEKIDFINDTETWKWFIWAFTAF